MNTNEIAPSLATLFGELAIGAPRTAAYMLNGGDVGLLRSLDKIDAAGASRVHGGGSSIAAHVDHLRYGLSLLNRWAGGEDPWADADWSVSWRKTTLTEGEWKQLRADLETEVRRWLAVIGGSRDVNEVELNGIIGSIAHLAYHIGAIRQIDRATRGPAATD